MYSVSSELYRQVAERLSEAVGSKSYFSGSIAGAAAGVDYRLTVSVIVYRERLSLPEGDCQAICDLVPVWWEFHTAGPEGECLNDFEFAEMKRYL